MKYPIKGGSQNQQQIFQTGAERMGSHRMDWGKQADCFFFCVLRSIIIMKSLCFFLYLISPCLKCPYSAIVSWISPVKLNSQKYYTSSSFAPNQRIHIRINWKLMLSTVFRDKQCGQKSQTTTYSYKSSKLLELSVWLIVKETSV